MSDEERNEVCEAPDLQHGSLPVALRYRKNALRGWWIAVGALFAGAIVAAIAFRHPVFAVPPVAIAIGLAVALIAPARHMRKLDHLHLEPRVLVIKYRDGTARRWQLFPGTEFMVIAGETIDSLVMMTKSDHHARRELVAFDLLDLPAGRSIHDFCGSLNQPCGVGTSLRVGPSATRRAGQSAIRRRLDWYRNPQRMSRAAFLLSVVSILALCAGVYFGLSEIWGQLGLGGGRWVWAVAKLLLAFLIVQPAFRFLAIARLRDLGEGANHRNVGGLLWKTTAGPLRLFLAKGELGANLFGLEPRL